jgi:hypothetical protein
VLTLVDKFVKLTRALRGHFASRQSRFGSLAALKLQSAARDRSSIRGEDALHSDPYLWVRGTSHQFFRCLGGLLLSIQLAKRCQQFG